MRPGRLPIDHPKEKEARAKLRVSPPKKEKLKKPVRDLPHYKNKGF